MADWRTRSRRHVSVPELSTDKHLRLRPSDLLLGICAWFVLLLISRVGADRLAPTVAATPFSRSPHPAGLFLLLAAISGLAAALMFRTGRLGFSSRWMAAFAGVALWESGWFALAVPAITRGAERGSWPARQPVLLLMGESMLPGVVAAGIWIASGICRSRLRRGLLVAAGALVCLGVVAVVSPPVIRGSLEAAGLLEPLTVKHLSGVHEPGMGRHLALLFVATLPGVLFFLLERRRDLCAWHASRVE